MVSVECPGSLQTRVWRQVQALHAAQTQPFEGLIADYAACLQHARELEVCVGRVCWWWGMHTLPAGHGQGRWEHSTTSLSRSFAARPTPRRPPRLSMPRHTQVRVGVLEREKAELTDEAGALKTQLAATDEASARDFATRAEGYRHQLARANSELTALLRDKAHVSVDGVCVCVVCPTPCLVQTHTRGSSAGSAGGPESEQRVRRRPPPADTAAAPHPAFNTTHAQTLEELLSLRHQVDHLKAAQEEASQEAELAREEAAGVGMTRPWRCLCVWVQHTRARLAVSKCGGSAKGPCRLEIGRAHV